MYVHVCAVCMYGCIYLHVVVSGSRDATLRVWDVDSGQCTTVLQGHLAAVRW